MKKAKIARKRRLVEKQRIIAQFCFTWLYSWQTKRQLHLSQSFSHTWNDDFTLSSCQNLWFRNMLFGLFYGWNGMITAHKPLLLSTTRHDIPLLHLAHFFSRYFTVPLANEYDLKKLKRNKFWLWQIELFWMRRQ